MRIYQPKNELGQAMLNEGQLVCTSKSITKSLTGGAIVLTDSDVSGITNWIVKSVYCTIKGQEISFSPDVVYGLDGITLRFSHDGENICGLTGTRVTLQASDAQGFGSEEEELIIDILIREAKATGDVSKVDEYVDGVIAGKDKEEIQSLGTKLASSGIEEYTLAGATTAEEAVALMTQSGNMGAFSSPIATLNEHYELVLNDPNFSYNMMSLEKGKGGAGYSDGLFRRSNVVSFNSDIPSLTNGSSMFYGCSNLSSFTSDLSSITEGACMFNQCYNLTSFTIDLPELTDGRSMFSGCYSLTSFTSDLPELTDGSYMFYCCDKLTSFTSDLTSLTTGHNMFDYCTSLTYVNPKNCKNSTALNQIINSLPTYSKADGSHMILFSTGDEVMNIELTATALQKGWGVGTEELESAYYYYGSKDMTEFYYNLVDGSDMFSYDWDLTEWNYDMPNLTNGRHMFDGCSNLKSFISEIPSLTNGVGMFYNCDSLTSFTSELPNLEYANYMFANGPIESWDIDLPSLTDGSEMFKYCSKLTSFSSDLSSLTDGDMMFLGCHSLTSFTTELPKLTNGDMMFDGCDLLLSFTSELPKLKYASYMFAYGPIVSWDIDLPNLNNGGYMFVNCINLRTFASDLSKLTDGYGMFLGCNSLTYVNPKNCSNSKALNEIIESLPYYNKADGSHIILFSTGDENVNAQLTSAALLKGWGVGTDDVSAYYYYGSDETNPWYYLVDGSNKFSYDTSLVEWTYDMPNLTNGENMFYNCSGLSSFTGELPKLKYGRGMFSGFISFEAPQLTVWNIDLPSLVDGEGMFSSCSSLTSFSSVLPSLTNGENMFSSCYDLTSFNIELPSLTNGQYMFNNCYNLSSFTPWGKNEDGTLKNSGNTGKLTNCYEMFHNCKLDLGSVKRIADWLPQRTSSKPTGYESSNGGWIHIGVASGVNTGTEFDNAISKITSKKWSVVICVNGAHTNK